MTQEQIEKAKVVVLQTIASAYAQQYGTGVGEWESARLVSLTPSEYVINATRKKINAPEPSNDKHVGPTLATRGFEGGYQRLAC